MFQVEPVHYSGPTPSPSRSEEDIWDFLCDAGRKAKVEVSRGGKLSGGLDRKGGRVSFKFN